MSCHNIGHGLNTVSMVVSDLLDEGAISRDAAKKILLSCKNAVNWCDGNEYEATMCIRNTLCGHCLQKNKNLHAVSVEMYEANYRELVTDFICDDCLKLLSQKER